MIDRAVTRVGRALPRHPHREHAGDFPLWLAPVQARVLPSPTDHSAYADGVRARLRDAGLRVEVDARASSIGPAHPRRRDGQGAAT